MLLQIPAGSTSITIPIVAYDATSSVGSFLSGLVYDATGLTCYYNRDGASGGAVEITLADMTKGTWASGGFVAIDASNMEGLYHLGAPDAVFASGAKHAVVEIYGASSMVPFVAIIELTATNNQDNIRGGLQALPNATAGVSAGVLLKSTVIDGTGGSSITFATALTQILAGQSGNVNKTGDVYDFLNREGATAFTITIAASTRTRS